MPLVACAALAYAVGLALAVSGAVGIVPLVVSGAGTCLAATIRRRHTVAACAALFMAGVFGGAAATTDDRRCRARLTAEREWDAELLQHAEAGSVARATLRGAGCQVPATLLVATGEGGAGELATVRGVATAESDRIVVR